MKKIFILFLLPIVVELSHYKGGTVTWKPVNSTLNATPIAIQISIKHSWTLKRFACDRNLINNRGLYFDNSAANAYPTLVCQSSPSLCTSSLFKKVDNRTLCTDYSNIVEISTGAYYETQYLSKLTNIDIAWTGGDWADEIYVIGGSPPGNLAWYVGTHIDLTQPIYPINSSPVTGSLPIIRVIENQLATIQIPAADWDTGQTLKCRFASNSYGYGPECAGICGNLPGANISETECTMSWFAVRKTYDKNNGILTSLYVAAIVVEDFAPWISTTVRLSSVPLQMLIYVYTPVTGACSIKPNITGDRPNRACIGVDINVQLTERIVADVYCTGDTIVEFITTSPLFMTKSTISPVPGYTTKFYITLTWTPVKDQYGPQVFCAAPIDQKNLTGDQYCVNYVVGYRSPELILPILVQGSASPLGTVFVNQTLFSISASNGVYHPNRNGTFIKIYLASTNTLVWQVDCGWSPLVVYTGQTVVFRVPNPPWIPGQTYYILFDSGAVSGNVFCGPESAPITNKNFWVFNIWNPDVSSTTTTTTTPPTTHTVTTRSMATTTPNANLTTVGITIGSSTTQTSTTSTSTSSTSATTTSITTPEPPTTTMKVISAKDFEALCKQPVLIMSIVTHVGMIPIKMIAMFSLFTKLNKMFNPHRISHRLRLQKFQNRVHAS